MILNPQWVIVLSDLFTNLSAGWFGAALIVPVTSKRRGSVRVSFLISNMGLGILFLVFAHEIRRLVV